MPVKLAKLFPLSLARKERAVRLLERSQRFWGITSDESQDVQPESADYPTTKLLEPRLDEYFGFRIAYYPLFQERQIWDSPWSWVYFADINDEMTEQKFKTDQDIRAYVTAFRLSIERNRRGIILLKRIIQTLAMVALFVPALILAFDPDSSVWLSLLAAAIVLALGLAYQSTRDSQLKSVIERNGKTLANKIQDRVNNLNKNFIEFLAGIDREEASEDMTDPEWTHRSAWWMKMAMWNPKRIEYIEKFLQSEMQRTRVFMLRSGLVGRVVAFALFAATASAAAIALSFLPSKPVSLTAVGDSMIGFWAAAAASLALTLFSLRSSIRLRDIADALGKEPLGKSSRFADIELHNKLGEQVRRDKEKLRQDKLAGGYAENKKQRTGTG